MGRVLSPQGGSADLAGLRRSSARGAWKGRGIRTRGPRRVGGAPSMPIPTRTASRRSVATLRPQSPAGRRRPRSGGRGRHRCAGGPCGWSASPSSSWVAPRRRPGCRRGPPGGCRRARARAPGWSTSAAGAASTWSAGAPGGRRSSWRPATAAPPASGPRTSSPPTGPAPWCCPGWPPAPASACTSARGQRPCWTTTCTRAAATPSPCRGRRRTWWPTSTRCCAPPASPGPTCWWATPWGASSSASTPPPTPPRSLASSWSTPGPRRWSSA